MRDSVLILLVFTTVLLLSNEVSSTAPSEIASAASPNSSDLRSNDIRDSHLEHVHVKQETGFDGKVRSIRFSLEPDNDTKSVEGIAHEAQADDSAKSKSTDAGDMEASVPSSLLNAKSNSDSTSNGSSTSRERRMTQPLQDRVSPMVAATALRMRRSIENGPSNNELDDLVAEEAKVFRPLFVYRQQVAKRLKLRGNSGSVGDRRRTQRTKPNTYGYYYPSHYPPYNYYPYPYQPYRSGY